MPTPDDLRILTPIAVLVFFFIGLKRPVWCAVSYLILVYCKVSYFFPLFAAIKSELVFALVILIRILFARKSFANLSPHYNSVNKYFYIFTATIALSFVVAIDHRHSWDAAVYHYIKVFILYIIIICSLHKLRELKIFIWSFTLMMAYLTYEPLVQFFSGTGGSEHSYGTNYISEVGLLSGHVALANNMNQMIPIVFYLLLSYRSILGRVLAAIPLAGFVGALIGSGSRGGVFGFGFLSLVFVYFSRNRSRALIICTVLTLILLTVSTSLVTTASRVDVSSTTNRLTGLTHGIGMLLKGNVIGVGPGCFQIARRQIFSYGMAAHNIYGELLGDLGIPGTIAWTLLIAQIFRNLIKSKSLLRGKGMDDGFLYHLALGLQVSLIVRLFISMASHGLYFFYWYLIAAVSAAICHVVKRESEAMDEAADQGVGGAHPMKPVELSGRGAR